MKKTSKIVAVVLAALLVVAAVVVLSACDGGEKASYGLVHNQGYVCKATVKLARGKVVDASLDEACFPTEVKAAAEDGEFTVVNGSNIFWKTVKWDKVTAVYDATDGYKVGEKTLKEHFGSEANCKAYFEAVAANKVTVVTSEGNKTDIMNAASLLKTKNGYWSDGKIRDGQIGWKANVEATVNYVKEYGFDGFGANMKKEDLKRDSGVEGNLSDQVVDSNGVKTGATWTDFLDYFYLLKAASEK